MDTVKYSSSIPYHHFATSGNLSLASGERSPSNQHAKARPQLTSK